MSKAIIIQAPDGLVLRDGKPFGDENNLCGGYNILPAPQTVAGCLRTAIGHKISHDYFTKAENIEEILKIEIGRQHFLMNPAGESEALFPVPADIFCTDKADTSAVEAHLPMFKELEEGCGTDLGYTDWLYPAYTTREKPSRNAPYMLLSADMEEYIKGKEPKDKFWCLCSCFGRKNTY